MIAREDIQYILDSLAQRSMLPASIPECYRCEDLYVALAEDKGYGWLEEALPLAEFTDRIRLAVVKSDPRMIKLFSPQGTENYTELAIQAIIGKPELVAEIDDHVFDKAMLSRVFAEQGQALLFFINFKRDIISLLDRELINLAISNSVLAASRAPGLVNVPLELIDDESLRKGIHASPSDTYTVKSLGKEHVLVDLVREGYWPQGEGYPDRPEDLKSGLSSFMNNSHTLWGADWMQAYVKTHPISDVVQLMKTNTSRLKRLQEMYTKEELFDHLKGIKSVRREWISSDMGV